MGGGSLGAQGQNRGGHAPDIRIGRNQAFRVQLANGYMHRPLVPSDLAQTIQRQIDTFADADSRGASERQSIGGQVVCTTQFPLQELIVLRGKRSGQIMRMRREVLAANQAGLDGVAVGGQIVEQTAETEEEILAGLVAQRRILFAQLAEPGEQMGIAPQLGEPADLRERGAQMAEEVAGHPTIAVDSAWAQSQG